MFKTAGKYGFDSVILTDANMKVLNGYISYITPLLKPQCDFVLVNRNGGQRGKLGEITNKVVFDAIGKYIHPMRYRRIVETQRRTGFCPKAKNTALLLLKFTIRSNDPEKLL